jgi:hypothetical protein
VTPPSNRAHAAKPTTTAVRFRLRFNSQQNARKQATIHPSPTIPVASRWLNQGSPGTVAAAWAYVLIIVRTPHAAISARGSLVIQKLFILISSV